MRTREEIRDWLNDLEDEQSTTPQQAIAIVAARDTLRWVLSDQESGDYR